MSHRNNAITAAYLSFTVALLLAGFASAIRATPSPSGYHILKTIPLGGTEGWDYISMDSDSRRLYIGRSTHMDMVDVDSGMVVAKLTDMPGVHGIALVPDFGRGFTVEDNDTSSVLDLKTLKKIGTVKTGKDPDS
jgi:hypothetical protein